MCLESKLQTGSFLHLLREERRAQEEVHETPRISTLGVKPKRAFPEEEEKSSFVAQREEGQETG